MVMHADVIKHWISRFDLWPYLEQFTSDVIPELMAELGGTPDLVIGAHRGGSVVLGLRVC